MTTTPASTPTPALDRFFDSLRRSSVTRSQDRVIAGVCSGIAQRFGISAAIVRVGAVVLALFGPGVFLYLLAWLFLPRYDGQVRLERAIRGGEASSIVLLIVAALAIVRDPVRALADGPLAAGRRRDPRGRGLQEGLVGPAPAPATPATRGSSPPRRRIPSPLLPPLLRARRRPRLPRTRRGSEPGLRGQASRA